MIAFLDDDARAEPDWLEQALRLFERVEPSPFAVGGPIEPFYLAPKPDWFKDEYEIRSWGDEPRFLRTGETFSGSNMIFTKTALRVHGGFSDRFGMKGERLSVGEETVLFDEIWRGSPDAPLYYSPELVVRTRGAGSEDKGLIPAQARACRRSFLVPASQQRLARRTGLVPDLPPRPRRFRSLVSIALSSAALRAPSDLGCRGSCRVHVALGNDPSLPGDPAQSEALSTGRTGRAVRMTSAHA